MCIYIYMCVCMYEYIYAYYSHMNYMMSHYLSSILEYASLIQ